VPPQFSLLLVYLKRDSPDLETSACTRIVPFSLVITIDAVWYGRQQEKAESG
jgi:hypothetical protein